MTTRRRSFGALGLGVVLSCACAADEGTWQAQGEDELGAETGAYVPAWVRGPRPRVARTVAGSIPPREAFAPPEWSPLEGILLRWPVGWPELKPMYVQLVEGFQPAAQVYIAVSGSRARAEVLRDLAGCARCRTQDLRFVTARTGTIWMRDYGPEFIHADGALGVVDLDYYPGRYDDDVFPRAFARSYQHTVFTPGISLEGGNFQSDGRGGCFISKGALEANDNDQERVFEALRSFLGCQRTTVVDYLREEGTHHIDMWMKVVSPTTVLVGDYSPTGTERLRYPDTVNDRVLDRVADQVRAAGYQVVRIPQPPARESPLGEGYTILTYTNSTFANDRVLIPVYGTPMDQQAVAVYDRVLPRQVTEVPIQSDYAIDFGGSIHCVTMERFRAP